MSKLSVDVAVLLAGIAIAGTGSSSALAQSIPDGRYDCGMLSGRTLMAFGSIQIAGATFRNGASGASYPYSLGANNVIQWGGPLTAIEGDTVKILSTVYKGIEPHNNEPFFDIIVQLQQNSPQRMSCTRVH